MPHLKRFGCLAVLAMGCTRPTASAPPPITPAAATPAEQFFPLVEGKLYHYVTRQGAETGMVVAKVARADAAHGELRFSNGTKRFTIGGEGVAYDGGAFVLKTPLEAGTTWPGEHGGTTRIDATGISVVVAAGSYSGCLRTVEDRTRTGARYETTFCPGIGIVMLVASDASGEGRIELRSYGAPVTIQ